MSTAYRQDQVPQPGLGEPAPAELIASNYRPIKPDGKRGERAMVEITIPEWQLKIDCVWSKSLKGFAIQLPQAQRTVSFTSEDARFAFQKAAQAATRAFLATRPNP